MSQETKNANATRAQKVKEVHEEKQRERLGNAQTLKAAYLELKDNIALKDILAKCASFANYHISVGRDGVGADKDGNIIYFTNEKRVSEFDRSAGQQEIIDYINRMIADPVPVEQETQA